MTAPFTYDELHVLSDAVACLRERIEEGDDPWHAYMGDDDDPKLSEEGYTALVEALTEKVRLTLEATAYSPNEVADNRAIRATPT